MQQLFAFPHHIFVLELCLVLVASELVNRVHCRRSGATELDDDETYDSDDIGSRSLAATDRDYTLGDDAAKCPVEDYGDVVDSLDRAQGDECQGPTCEFRTKCGLAPLNELPQARYSERSSLLVPHIINGERQVYGEWPSFAQLKVVWNWWGVNGRCGGVVISDRHIMTAGHCVLSSYYGRAREDRVTVVIGDDMLWKSDAYERAYTVESICIPSKYLKADDNQTVYDYAVLTLKDQIQLDDYSQPACLPYAPWNTSTSVCYLVGAGASYVGEDGRSVLPDGIQKMRVHEVSCKAYGFGDKDISRECYTKLGSQGDSCVGDSGGPILCLHPDTKRWTLVALVSYGSLRCDGKDKQGWTAVYSRVSSLLPNMKDECGL